MTRITELALPLDCPPSALRKAIVKRIGIEPADLLDFTVFKRSYDARKKHAVTFVYIIDLTARNEAAILKRLAADRNVRAAPDYLNAIEDKVAAKF